MKKKLIKIWIITVCIYLGSLTARWLYRYEYYRVETELDYCKDIAQKINYIGLRQFYCESIEEKDGIVVFYCQSNAADKTSPFRREYSFDDGARDIIIVKNFIVDYLNNHPENELNGKKVKFVFHIIHNSSFQMYNYNYLNNGRFEDSKDFSYFEHLWLEHISVLKEFGDVRVLDISLSDMDYYDFFQDWHALQYVRIITQDLTERQKQELKEMLPVDCILETIP